MLKVSLPINNKNILWNQQHFQRLQLGYVFKFNFRKYLSEYCSAFSTIIQTVAGVKRENYL